MYCSKCGKQMDDSSTFCSGCGAPLQNQINYAVPDINKSRKPGFGVAALVLGIVGVLAWIIPIIGLPVGIIALVLGIIGLKKSSKGMSIVGIVLGISDEALELMRDNCTELRDLAMIDMLASTGMRVGEMVLLNREDIDFNERECVVFGKGDKERIVYFDARTKIHLQNYLNSRKDDNPALFVSLQSPYNRMNIGGIEVRLRQLGKRLGLNKVHPHKFRRTLATMAIDKGMPIEQLQQLLGHKRIDTTLQYAMVKQSNVKIAHRKYIG